MNKRNKYLTLADLQCESTDVACAVRKMLEKHIFDLVSKDPNNKLIIGTDSKLFVA